MSFIKKLFGGKGKKENDDEEYFDDEEYYDDDEDYEDDYYDDEDEESWDGEDEWDEDDDDWEDGDWEEVDEEDDWEDDEEVEYVYEDDDDWEDDEEVEYVYEDEDGNIISEEEYQEWSEEYEDDVEWDEDWEDDDTSSGSSSSFEWDDDDEDDEDEFDWEDEEETETITFDNEEPISFEEDYDEVDEFEADSENVNINFGDSGLLDSKKLSKERVYQEMMYEITNRDVEIISNAITSHDTIYEIFAEIEANEVPLQYVVALDIFKEEEVSGYRAYQQRGLLEGERESINEVHETPYIHEVLKQRGISLKEIIDEQFDKNNVPRKEEPVTYETSVEVDESTENNALESNLKNDYNEASETISEVSTSSVEDYMEETPDEPIAESMEDVLQRIESLGKNTAETTPDETETPLEQDDSESVESIDLGDVLGGEIPETPPVVPEVAQVVLPVTQENEKIKRMNELSQRAEDETPKKVLVVCEGIQLPEMLGKYEMAEVLHIKDLSTVELSLDSVLLLTRLIREDLRKPLAKWLESHSKEDVRVVTLGGAYEVKHPIVDTVVELTEESLDTYMREFEKEQDKREMGGHLDISQFFN